MSNAKHIAPGATHDLGGSFATLLAALKDLTDAEKAHRTAFEAHGADDFRTGRAREALQRAAARARVLHRAHAVHAEKEGA